MGPNPMYRMPVVTNLVVGSAHRRRGPSRRLVAIIFAALILVTILATRGDRATTSSTPRALPAADSNDGHACVVLGHARNALGRRADAIAAYERAIAIDRDLASDPEIRATAIKMLDTRDILAAVLALELLATRVSPPARDAILAQASNGKIADVRHRALAIAERDGIADGVDRIESWSLDLDQAAGCDERRAAIEKLRASRDRRALGVLRRARAKFPCVEHDAATAIAELEAR